jgi:hypothetical protein
MHAYENISLSKHKLQSIVKINQCRMIRLPDLLAHGGFVR